MIKVALVGNPNTGKTTLYNSLTSSHEHVGNWHGVTVEERGKIYKYKNEEILMVDLPGIYSLTPLSYEEGVAVKYLHEKKPELVVNICDASNLRRNLYLTLSLLEMGLPCILVVNQIDKKPICKIDFAKLERLLGVKVVYVDASSKKNVERVNEEILRIKSDPSKTTFVKPPYMRELLKLVDNSLIDSNKLKDFYLIKLLENDDYVKEKFDIKKEFDLIDEVASARYGYIDNVLSCCCSANERIYGQSKFDKILLNRFLALPIFILIIAAAFYLTFFSVGVWLSDGLQFVLDKLLFSPLSNCVIGAFGKESWICGLFCDAIIGGVGSIITFLPQVALLFFFLSLLEDSGYLSRVAFVFEDILGKVGLSGKSVYTLLMGFGCSTTAVLTARNMEDKNSKIKTGLLTPYMSCSAKFPIYSVLGGAFFGAKNIFVILGLYFLGVFIAILMSLIYEKTFLKSKAQSFILEFPPYRMMSLKRTGTLLLLNIKDFLVRVASLILAMNVIVWLLSSFSITFKYVAYDGGVSMLETFGKLLAPIFKPLGFSSWGLISALIAGLVAKEVIVSSIAMFNGVEGADLIGASVMSVGSAAYFASSSGVLSYLVFCLLYFPCVATASVLAKEIGGKWLAIGLISEFIIAYLASFVVYNLSRACVSYGWWVVLLFILAIVIIAFSFKFVARAIKSGKCLYANRCNRSCKKK